MRINSWLLAAMTCTAALAGDDVPGWFREFASTKTPSYSAKVSAVVILRERRITVDEGGRATTIEREVVKVLNREGRNEAVGATRYYTGTGKVRDFHAWMMSPSGAFKKYNKDQILDAAVAPNDVYNDARVRLVSGSDDADPESVFGFESVSEEKSVFTQYDFEFQHHLPALLSRFALTLPAGWRAEARLYNHDNIVADVSGSTWTWELRNLPYLQTEASAPDIASLAPRVAVSYFPAAGAKTGMGRTLENWNDVARWMGELEETQGAPTPGLEAKTHDLVAGAKSEFDRIRAIGEYVQAVHYVSIQTGIGRGGGYQPHPAGEVFMKQYGDCKDKANLMRTMLKVAGIPSYMISIWSGDRTRVREDWPSPQQFNHAIIAIKVSDVTQAPAMAEHPKLGRLLLFDPTDEYTPLGDLPDHEQGSLALIDGVDGGLMRMPVVPPSANRAERVTEMTLAPDGSIQAKMHESSFGQTAASWRRRYHRQSRPDYDKSVERWIGRDVNNAAVSKIEASDQRLNGQFDLAVEFSAERYGQLMQGRLLMFRPSLLPRRDGVYLTEKKRQWPVVLNAQSWKETVKVTLPAGFTVDEMPDHDKLDTLYGSYTAQWAVEKGELLFTHTLEVKEITVPASDYAKVRAFFERVQGVEGAPVVLAKK